MGVEKFRGLTKEDPDFSPVIERAKQFTSADRSLAFAIAGVMSLESGAGIAELERTLEARIGPIPENQVLFPKPGTFLYDKLTPDEKIRLGLNYGAAWLIGLMLAVDNAKDDSYFYPTAAVSMYKHRVEASRFIAKPEDFGRSRISHEEIKVLFRRNDGVILFTDDDLKVLHPHLRNFMDVWEILPALRDLVIPVQIALVKQVQEGLDAEKALEIASTMPVAGREDGRGLTQEQLRKSEITWRRLLDMDPKGPSR